MSGKIAPNQGQELRNLLTGKAPLISFKEALEPKLLATVIYLHLKCVVTMRTASDSCITISMFGDEVYSGDREFNLYESLIDYAKQYGVDEFYHTAMGRLHGYSDDDIREFLTNPPECDCSQCKGL